MSNDTESRQQIYKHIAEYSFPSWIYSFWSFFSNIALFWICVNIENPWIMVLMFPLFALSIVRLFIIFHDMGHCNFFPDTFLNKYVGYFVGMIVLTPYEHWVRLHNHHHSYSNNLDKPQYSQTAAYDIETYNEKGYFHRLVYRLMFGKYTLFTIMPWIYFVIIQHIYAKWYEIVLHIAYFCWLYYNVTIYQVAYILLAYWVAGVIGFMLFHIQHTFDGAYREKKESWDSFKNGIYGSSLLEVPWYLKYFTCGIEYHHVHHINSKVPGYYLESCHNAKKDLFTDVKRVKIDDIFSTMHYSLYDVSAKKFVDVYALN